MFGTGKICYSRNDVKCERFLDMIVFRFRLEICAPDLETGWRLSRPLGLSLSIETAPDQNAAHFRLALALGTPRALKSLRDRGHDTRRHHAGTVVIVAALVAGHRIRSGERAADFLGLFRTPFILYAG